MHAQRQGSSSAYSGGGGGALKRVDAPSPAAARTTGSGMPITRAASTFPGMEARPSCPLQLLPNVHTFPTLVMTTVWAAPSAIVLMPLGNV